MQDSRNPSLRFGGCSVNSVHCSSSSSWCRCRLRSPNMSWADLWDASDRRGVEGGCGNLWDNAKFSNCGKSSCTWGQAVQNKDHCVETQPSCHQTYDQLITYDHENLEICQAPNLGCSNCWFEIVMKHVIIFFYFLMFSQSHSWPLWSLQDLGSGWILLFWSIVSICAKSNIWVNATLDRRIVYFCPVLYAISYHQRPPQTLPHIFPQSTVSW